MTRYIVQHVEHGTLWAVDHETPIDAVRSILPLHLAEIELWKGLAVTMEPDRPPEKSAYLVLDADDPTDAARPVAYVTYAESMGDA